MILKYVYGQNAPVSGFVAELTPHCRRGFGANIMTIGVIEVNTLIAGIVYHNYDPEAEIIEISGAALPGHFWLTRETLKRMFEYPFLGLNCQMVVQRTPADNERLLSVLARYNYSFVKLPRLFGRDRDGVICCLTREAWQNNKFNRRLTEPQLEEAA